MKKLMLMFLFLILVVTYGSAERLKIKLNEDANVRTKPSRDGKIVTVLLANDVGEGYICDDNPNWYYIEAKGKSGYVHKSVVKRTSILKTEENIRKENKEESFFDRHPIFALICIFGGTLILLGLTMCFSFTNTIITAIISILGIILAISVFKDKKPFVDYEWYMFLLLWLGTLYRIGPGAFSDSRELVCRNERVHVGYDLAYEPVYAMQEKLEETGLGPIGTFFATVVISGIVMALIVFFIFKSLYDWKMYSPVIIILILSILNLLMKIIVVVKMIKDK